MQSEECRKRRLPLMVIPLLVLLTIAAVVTAVLVFDPGVFRRLANRYSLLPSNERLELAEAKFQRFLSERNLKEAPTDISIRIFKSKRRLELLSGGKVLKTYKIALGPSPKGHKERKGDGKTPIGQYYVCTRNPQSKFTLFLGISYPNKEDAERGLRKGLIGRNEYEVICRAIDAMKCPPWDTSLGGEIGIHGGGTDRDWTAGCIALDDEDIAELWNLAPLGTPVFIEE